MNCFEDSWLELAPAFDRTLKQRCSMTPTVHSRTIGHVGMLEQDPKQPALLSRCA